MAGKETKMLTWNNGLKRGWVGPNRFSLWNSCSKSVLHLFVHCRFTTQVWKGIKNDLKIRIEGTRGDLESWLKTWKEDKTIPEDGPQ
jgi:hypothetical protein